MRECAGLELNAGGVEGVAPVLADEAHDGHNRLVAAVQRDDGHEVGGELQPGRGGSEC